MGELTAEIAEAYARWLKRRGRAYDAARVRAARTAQPGDHAEAHAEAEAADQALAQAQAEADGRLAPFVVELDGAFVLPAAPTKTEDFPPDVGCGTASGAPSSSCAP